MLRLSLLLLVSILSVHAVAKAETESIQIQQAVLPELEQALGSEDELIEYTELEYQLIEASGLLSLSQQVKYSAQRLIALSSEQSEANASADTKSSSKTETEKGDAKQVVINHAQHFAIAKNLAESWTESAWQQRLLDLVHAIPEATQELIKKQLKQPLLRAAQRKEQDAMAVQNSPAYRLYTNKLRQRPPSAARWQLVENLDKQSGFSQMIIQARLAVIQEMQQQVKGWQPEELWKNQARQEVLEFLFYAYRKTPNNELKQIAQSFNRAELNQFYADVRNIIY
jgi:hypothetical protein